MTESASLRFPNGHTIAQIKRNAKRLSKMQGISLHKALDALAESALGLTSFPIPIHWAEATRAVEESVRRYNLPENFTFRARQQNLWSNSGSGNLPSS